MTKKEKRLAAVADALWKCLENGRSICQLLGVVPNRARAALFARDWNPTLMHLAKIEAEIGEDVFTVPLNTNDHQ